MSRQLPPADPESGVVATVKELQLAVEAARDLVEGTSSGPEVYWDAVTNAFSIREWMLNYHGTIDADRLIATVWAAYHQRCLVGAFRPTRCSSPHQRALVTRSGDTSQGCFQHIAEDLVRLRESAPDSPEWYEIHGPAGIPEAIEALVASGQITAVGDEEIDLAEVMASMPYAELEWDLAQHAPACIAGAITEAYALGHDDEDTVRQMAAQVLEERPRLCRCPDPDS